MALTTTTTTSKTIIKLDEILLVNLSIKNVPNAN